MMVVIIHKRLFLQNTKSLRLQRVLKKVNAQNLHLPTTPTLSHALWTVATQNATL